MTTKLKLQDRLAQQIRTDLSMQWKCPKSQSKPYPSGDLHSRQHNSKCIWNPLINEAVKKTM